MEGRVVCCSALKIMTGDIYHICNRGIEKGKIFYTKKDYRRFLECLYKFNNTDGAIRTDKTHFSNFPPRKKQVEVLKWTLMSNHYHLLLYEVINGGVVDFIKRLGNGYTKYINTKNQRSGYLFQNKAKCILVTDESHFLHIPFYIDLNPFDLQSFQPRDMVGSPAEVIEKLKNQYSWTSLGSYYGTTEFDPIINKDLFYEVFDTNPARYAEDFIDLLGEKIRIDKAEGFEGVDIAF